MSNCWQFALWTIKLFSVSKNNYLLSLWCVPRGVRAREAVRLLACLVLWTIIKLKKTATCWVLGVCGEMCELVIGKQWGCRLLYPLRPPRPRTSSHVLILYFILKRKLSKTCWGSVSSSLARHQKKILTKFDNLFAKYAVCVNTPNDEGMHLKVWNCEFEQLFMTFSKI